MRQPLFIFREDERRQLVLAYFLYFITAGLFLPYFPSYLRSQNVTELSIGWVLSLAPLMRVAVPPLLGLLADRAQGPRFWGMVAAWGACAGLACVGLGSTAYVTLLFGAVLYSIFNAPIISLLDASAMHFYDQQQTASRFGHIRLWGSAGFMVTSFGLGFFYPDLPAHVIITSLIITHILFASFVSVSRVDDVPPASPRLSDLPLLLRQRRIWLLLSTLFLNRAASAPFNGFYTIFVQEKGLGGDVVALTWGIAVGTEIIVMILIDRFIDRFGVSYVLAFGVVLEAVRWFAYPFLSSKSALLLLAPAHGIAFGMLYVASVRAVSEIVPRQFRALGQGLNAAAAGCGQMIGFVGAGYLYQVSGSEGMFLAGGIVGVAAFINALLFGNAIVKTAARRLQ